MSPPTPAPSVDATLDKETFGLRLRTARKQLGWTLQQLAQRSGVSITTISRAERGLLALGYDNFAALAAALQMDLGELFAAAGRETANIRGPVVTRAGEGVAYRGESFVYEFLGANVVGKKMVPVLGTVHARRFNGPEDFAQHAGEEFLYVLSGRVAVHFATGEVVRLARGDLIYFDSRIGHAFVSGGRQPARIIGAITAESEKIRQARKRQPTQSLANATREAPAAGAVVRRSRGR